MTAVLLPNGKQQYFTTAGLPAVGYKLATFAAGTSTPQVTWQDALKVSPQTNPIILDGRGEASIFWEGAYKVQLQDSTGAVIWTQDNLQSLPNGYTTSLLPAVTNSVDLGSVTLSWRNLYLGPNNAPVLDTVSGNFGYFARTSGEVNALPNPVAPVNFSYPAQTGVRYGPNTTPGTTDMANALQAAIDSASSSSATVLIADQNAISKPLLIRTTTAESIGLYGNARVVTELEPKAASIAVAPVSINALIINQNNNAHLHLTHLRSADNNFTGFFMYAVPGGGADASCQASFSMVIDDCWFSPSSNGSGVFYGYYANMQMTNCVFESTKNGVIRMVGGSTGVTSGSSSDILCQNITMNGCFDAFLDGNVDSFLKALLTVDGLHAYGHFRGPLFQIINGVALHFSNVTLEASSSQISTVALFSLQDCAEINLHDMFCHSRSGVPQGAGPNAIINGCTGTITNVIADTVIGLQFTGAGVLNVTFENDDFSGGSLPLQFTGSTQTGQLIFRGCRFNNAQNECLSGTVATSIDFYDCEFINAGLNASAANNNVDLALAGGPTLNFIRCKFGQNNGSAAAGSYFKFTGTGTVNIIDPIIIGTPPTILVNAGSTLAINWDGINSNMPGFTGFVPSVGGSATYTTQYFNWSLKGRILSFTGRLTINAIGTGSASIISGLPFTSNGANYGSGTIPFFSALGATLVSLGFSVGPGTTSMTLRGLTAAGASTTNPSAITSGTDLIFSGSYPL